MDVKDKEFYLDISRYTFDYLFDNNKREIVVHLETIQERKIMSSILKHSFNYKSKWRGEYVSIKMGMNGFKTNFISKRDYVSFSRFRQIIIEYAQIEDNKIKHLTKKKLFENIIRSGFARLGIKKE